MGIEKAPPVAPSGFVPVRSGLNHPDDAGGLVIAKSGRVKNFLAYVQDPVRCLCMLTIPRTTPLISLANANMVRSMTARDTFLDEVEAYLEATGWSAAKLGVEAMGDSAFVFRLRAGRNVRLDTVDRMRRFMRDNPPPKKSRRAASAKTLALAS